jgi:hypothetical protein
MRRSVLLLVGLMLLTGCGGSSNNTATPSPPAMTNPAPTSPSANGATSPPPAHETGKQFIRRWQSVSDSMQLTGDSSAFDALNDPACKSCANFKASVERIYSSGGHVEASPTRILWIRSDSDTRTGADVTYHVREQVTPSRYQESPTGEWKTFPGGTNTQVFYLKHTTDGWRVLEYGQLAGSSSS